MASSSLPWSDGVDFFVSLEASTLTIHVTESVLARREGADGLYGTENPVREMLRAAPATLRNPVALLRSSLSRLASDLFLA